MRGGGRIVRPSAWSRHDSWVCVNLYLASPPAWSGCCARLELLALEAADEKARLLKLLGMAFAALLFLTLAVLVFTVSIAVAFWPTENRYLALGLLAGLYAVLGVGLLVAVRQALLYGPPPFSATLEELGRDAELLERVRDAHDEDPRRRGED